MVQRVDTGGTALEADAIVHCVMIWRRASMAPVWLCSCSLPDIEGPTMRFMMISRNLAGGSSTWITSPEFRPAEPEWATGEANSNNMLLRRGNASRMFPLVTSAVRLATIAVLYLSPISSNPVLAAIVLHTLYSAALS